MEKGFNNEPKKYVKKPIVVEAYRTNDELEIETLEGTMKASQGDFIITGVHGEKYPCKPDIFWETYEDFNDEDTSIEAFVLDNCIEWYNIISELSQKEEQLYYKKAEHDRKEFEIVFMSDIDFKELYGSTAKDVREHHAKTVLQELKDEIKGLELSIDYLKRRLTYLKGLVTVKTALIDAKKDNGEDSL